MIPVWSRASVKAFDCQVFYHDQYALHSPFILQDPTCDRVIIVLCRLDTAYEQTAYEQTYAGRRDLALIRNSYVCVV